MTEVRKKKFKINAGYLFIIPWIIGVCAFTIGPLIFSLIVSFFDWPVVGEIQFIGLNNYITMFTQDPMFYESLAVTLKFAALFVPVNIILSLGLALLLNQKVKGTGFFRTVFYLPSVISGVALAMVWAWVYSGEYGILNYLLSIIGIKGPNWLLDKTWAPVAMVVASLWSQGTLTLIFLAALKGVPNHLYEAASIDGASATRQFFTITIPMISPILLFNIITTIIASFQQLSLALLLTGGGPMNSTYFYAMYLYDNAFKYFKMGYSSANAWIMFIIILSLTAVVFRFSDTWVHYETEIKSKKTKKRGDKA